MALLFFLVIAGGVSLNEKNANSASKYNRQFKQSEKFKKEKFSEPLPVDPDVAPEDFIDSLFTSGFSNFTFKRLNLILPSYIRFSPEYPYRQIR